MALIYCRECGKQISNMAESCPHCGMPLYNIQPPPEYDMMTSEDAKEKKLKKWGWINTCVAIFSIIIFVIMICVDMDDGLQQVLICIDLIAFLAFEVIEYITEHKHDSTERNKNK